MESEGTLDNTRYIRKTANWREKYIKMVSDSMKTESFRNFLFNYSMRHAMLLKERFVNIDEWQCAKQMRRCMRYPYRHFMFSLDMKQFIDIYCNSEYAQEHAEINDPIFLDPTISHKKLASLLDLFVKYMVYDVENNLSSEAESDVESCIKHYLFRVHMMRKTDADQVDEENQEIQDALRQSFRDALREAADMYYLFLPNNTSDVIYKKELSRKTGVQVINEYYIGNNKNKAKKRKLDDADDDDDDDDDDIIKTEETLSISQGEQYFQVDVGDFDSSEDEDDADATELEIKAKQMLDTLQKVLEFAVDPHEIITEDELLEMEKKKYKNKYMGDSFKIDDNEQFTSADTSQFKSAYNSLCIALYNMEKAAGIKVDNILLPADYGTAEHDVAVKQLNELRKNIHGKQVNYVHLLKSHHGGFEESKKKELVVEMKKQLKMIKDLKMKYKLLYDQYIATHAVVTSKDFDYIDLEEAEMCMKRPLREICADFSQSALYKTGAHLELALMFPTGQWGGRNINKAAQMKKYLLGYKNYISQLSETLSAERYLFDGNRNQNNEILRQISVRTGIHLKNQLTEYCTIFYELCLQRITPDLVNTIQMFESADVKVETLESENTMFKMRERRLHSRITKMGCGIQYLTDSILRSDDTDQWPVTLLHHQGKISKYLNETILFFFKNRYLHMIAATALWMLHPSNPDSPSLIELNQTFRSVMQKQQIDTEMGKFDEGGGGEPYTEEMEEQHTDTTGMEINKNELLVEIDNMMNDYVDGLSIPDKKKLKDMRWRLNRFKPTWFLMDNIHADKSEVWIYFVLSLKLLESWIIKWNDAVKEYIQQNDTEQSNEQLRVKYQRIIPELTKYIRDISASNISDADLHCIEYLKGLLGSLPIAKGIWRILKIYFPPPTEADEISSVIDVANPLIQKIATQLQMRIQNEDPVLIDATSFNEVTFRYALYDFAWIIYEYDTTKTSKVETASNWTKLTLQYIDYVLISNETGQKISREETLIGISDIFEKYETEIQSISENLKNTVASEIMDFYNPKKALYKSDLLFYPAGPKLPIQENIIGESNLAGIYNLLMYMDTDPETIETIVMETINIPDETKEVIKDIIKECWETILTQYYMTEEMREKYSSNDFFQVYVDTMIRDVFKWIVDIYYKKKEGQTNEEKDAMMDIEESSNAPAIIQTMDADEQVASAVSPHTMDIEKSSDIDEEDALELLSHNHNQY